MKIEFKLRRHDDGKSWETRTVSKINTFQNWEEVRAMATQLLRDSREHRRNGLIMRSEQIVEIRANEQGSLQGHYYDILDT